MPLALPVIRSRRRWLALLPIGLLAASVPLAARTVGRLRDGAALAAASEPLQRPLAAPAARLLIVGDSTAVGTGASSPATSLAGLLAAAFPALAISNRARDGATFADVLRQLDGAAPQDIVLVQAGGNDVIRLRDLDVVREDVGRVLRRARTLAPHVVVMPAGNVGNAPFFFPPLSWWMSDRARRLHAAVGEAARRDGAIYVRLFRERADDPFAQQPALNARDGLHPSDAGYRVWFEELMRQSRWPALLPAASA